MSTLNKALLVAFLSILFSASSVRADNVALQITGTMTFGSAGTANLETVDFSFESLYTPDGYGGYMFAGLVPGTGTATATGLFSFDNMPAILGPGYLAFLPPSDVSQFYFGFCVYEDCVGGDLLPASGTFAGGDSEIWSCLSQACLNAYGYPGAQIGVGGPVTNGDLEFTRTVVAEPPGLLLLFFGALLVGLIGSTRTKS